MYLIPANIFILVVISLLLIFGIRLIFFQDIFQRRENPREKRCDLRRREYRRRADPQCDQTCLPRSGTIARALGGGTPIAVDMLAEIGSTRSQINFRGKLVRNYNGKGCNQQLFQMRVETNLRGAIHYGAAAATYLRGCIDTGVAAETHAKEVGVDVWTEEQMHVGGIASALRPFDCERGWGAEPEMAGGGVNLSTTGAERDGVWTGAGGGVTGHWRERAGAGSGYGRGDTGTRNAGVTMQKRRRTGRLVVLSTIYGRKYSDPAAYDCIAWLSTASLELAFKRECGVIRRETTGSSAKRASCVECPQRKQRGGGDVNVRDGRKIQRSANHFDN
ncbi:hypothetical protein C8R44DRAFT_734693 [Mycena epipterygia]|nr:hypothetical protein C8R44DRAFT_734693 [Mycena epipterygia]